MIVIKRKTIYVLNFILLAAISAITYYFISRTRININGHTIYLNTWADINPKKKYNLTLWDYEWPQKNGNEDYRTFLQNAVDKFRMAYPNINVRIEFLDHLDGPARLVQAVSKGEAPDVYCSGYEPPSFDYKWQIPVGPFLKKGEIKDYWEAFLPVCSIGKILCSFPRWSGRSAWIGNGAMLKAAGLDIEKIQQKGWTTEDIQNACRTLPAGIYALTGNLNYNGFFPQLVDGLQKPDESGIWKGQGLKNTANFLEYLVTSRKVPLEMDRNFLGYFLKNQAMVLAGVRPVFYRLIKDRPEGNNLKPVLLPAPRLAGGTGCFFGETGMVSVFRNKNTKGADHIAAAVQLGRFISNYNVTWPWEKILVYPAAKNCAEQWEKNTGLASGDLKFFQQYQNSGLRILGYRDARMYRERIYPALVRFCKGEAGKEDFLTGFTP